MGAPSFAYFAKGGTRCSWIPNRRSGNQPGRDRRSGNSPNLLHEISVFSSRGTLGGSAHDTGVFFKCFAAIPCQAAYGQRILPLECFFHGNTVGIFPLRQVAGKIPLGEATL